MGNKTQAVSVSPKPHRGKISWTCKAIGDDALDVDVTAATGTPELNEDVTPGPICIGKTKYYLAELSGRNDLRRRVKSNADFTLLPLNEETSMRLHHLWRRRQP